jgi:hypothetical protein
METPEYISLGITIGLGLLSIGLAIFSIWISCRFSSSSSIALDGIKELARETRILIEASLSQQKDFSSRMLDSILEQNRYGPEKIVKYSPPGKPIEDIIKERLRESEAIIASKVEGNVRQLVSKSAISPEQLNIALDAIRSEIGQLTGVASEISSVIQLPEPLRSALETFRKLPAHFVVLAAIIRSGAKTIDDIKKVESKFKIPEGYERGIENLLEKGLLESTKDGFKIPDAYNKPLEVWINRNWGLLSQLMNVYVSKEPGPASSDELEIGSMLEI